MTGVDVHATVRPAGAARGILLHDEHEPALREILGGLLSDARTADFAIARIRIPAIDLTPGELAGVRQCRVLVGRLDAATLSSTAGMAPAAARLEHLRALHAFLASGRLEIRSAGIGSWTPDFSVIAGLPPRPFAPAGAVCLVGAHYFSQPGPLLGPAFTCLIEGRAAVAAARARFEQLWELGYDVLPVVIDTVAALIATAASDTVCGPAEVAPDGSPDRSAASG